MIIRAADRITDFDTIMDGAKDFVRFVNKPTVLPDPDSPSLADAVQIMLAMPGMTVFLAENDSGVIEGGLAIFVYPSLWDRSTLAAEEFFWWCYPNAHPSTAMKLLRHTKQHCIKLGVKIISLHKMEDSPEAVDAAYRHIGTVPFHTTYIGVI